MRGQVVHSFVFHYELKLRGEVKIEAANEEAAAAIFRQLQKINLIERTAYKEYSTMILEVIELPLTKPDDPLGLVTDGTDGVGGWNV